MIVLVDRVAKALGLDRSDTNVVLMVTERLLERSVLLVVLNPRGDAELYLFDEGGEMELGQDVWSLATAAGRILQLQVHGGRLVALEAHLRLDGVSQLRPN
jgi:hypothetical protein